MKSIVLTLSAALLLVAAPAGAQQAQEVCEDDGILQLLNSDLPSVKRKAKDLKLPEDEDLAKQRRAEYLAASTTFRSVPTCAYDFIERRFDAKLLGKGCVWEGTSEELEAMNATDAIDREEFLVVTYAPRDDPPGTGKTNKFHATRIHDVDGVPHADKVKLKYGDTESNPGAAREVFTEAAGTALLTAIGAYADDIYPVAGVRCYGCPDKPHPFQQCIRRALGGEGDYEITIGPDFATHQDLDEVNACVDRYGGPGIQKILVGPVANVTRKQREQLDRLLETYPLGYRVDYNTFVEFPDVAVERKHEARRIEVKENQGWKIHELKELIKKGDPALRVEREALVLVMALLSHGDAKADNQRLSCLKWDKTDDEVICLEPVALIQDVGATFGTATLGVDKLNESRWSEPHFWRNKDKCRIRVEDGLIRGLIPVVLPGYHPEIQITQAGKEYFLSRVDQLSDAQLHDMFAGARFDQFPTEDNPQASIDAWVAAFHTRVEEIRGAGVGAQCPPHGIRAQ